MLEYEVSVDFHDNAISGPPKTFTSLSEVSLYLETIPGKLGFEMTGHATISIKTCTKSPHQQLAMSIEA